MGSEFLDAREQRNAAGVGVVISLSPLAVPGHLHPRTLRNACGAQEAGVGVPKRMEIYEGWEAVALHQRGVPTDDPLARGYEPIVTSRRSPAEVDWVGRLYILPMF